MNRLQFEHVLRAAAQIADDEDLVVLGSQAILGQFPDAPEALLVSVEVDLYPRNRPELFELIDGSIGELSPFHDTFGYYAHGIEAGTAVLPRGWEDRLIPFRNSDTKGATGWCLEVHDLLVSKLVAGRPKDLEFTRVVLEEGLAEKGAVRERLVATDLEPRLRHAVEARLERVSETKE